MKNSIVLTGITLLSLVNVCNASNVVDRKRDFNLVVLEAIDSVTTNRIIKTTEELIAQDNAITESHITNEAQNLDFTYINKNSPVSEIVESVNVNKIEKTLEELIAEDNAITESNISNEVQVLDFNFINGKSKQVVNN